MSHSALHTQGGYTFSHSTCKEILNMPDAVDKVPIAQGHQKHPAGIFMTPAQYFMTKPLIIGFSMTVRKEVSHTKVSSNSKTTPSQQAKIHIHSKPNYTYC